MKIRTVLVTSAGSGVGRAIADAARISDHSYRVIGMDCRPAFADDVRVPPTDSPEAFRRAVTAVARGAGPSLILPGRDPDVAVLADLTADLAAAGSIFPSGPSTAVTATLDKARTGDVLGIGDVFASTATTVEGAQRIAAATGWPLVVKPRFGSASRAVRSAGCASELSAAMTPADVAQEFLPLLAADRRPYDGTVAGRQDGEYSLQLVLGPRSEFLGSFCARHCLAAGRPVLVEVLDRAVAAPALAVLVPALQRIGATGCWNFQGRMAERGVRYFEVNGRTTGITGLRAALGFNELDLLYDAFVLQQRSARRPVVRPCVVDASDWTAPPEPDAARGSAGSPLTSAGGASGANN